MAIIKQLVEGVAATTQKLLVVDLMPSRSNYYVFICVHFSCIENV